MSGALLDTSVVIASGLAFATAAATARTLHTLDGAQSGLARAAGVAVG